MKRTRTQLKAGNSTFAGSGAFLNSKINGKRVKTWVQSTLSFNTFAPVKPKTEPEKPSINTTQETFSQGVDKQTTITQEIYIKENIPFKDVKLETVKQETVTVQVKKEETLESIQGKI